MKTTSDIDFPDQTLQVGTYLQVEDDCSPNGLVYILAGELAYRSIHVDHLGEVDVQELVGELEEMQIVRGKYLEGLAEAGRKIAALKDQNKLLQWDLELLDRKVTLPKDVAEAMDEYVGPDIGRDAKGWAVLNILRAHADDLNTSARTIKNYFGTDHMNFIEAVVRGYNVDPEPEKDQPVDLRTGVKAIVENVMALKNPF
ncbi:MULTISPECIES: hypothetical protein [unclassified Paenibacillus]|nr:MULTISPECIES: hypothetical protein [unclassified Paenibacillus]